MPLMPIPIHGCIACGDAFQSDGSREQRVCHPCAQFPPSQGDPWGMEHSHYCWRCKADWRHPDPECKERGGDHCGLCAEMLYRSMQLAMNLDWERRHGE